MQFGGINVLVWDDPEAVSGFRWSRRKWMDEGVRPSAHRSFMRCRPAALRPIFQSFNRET